ncbi:MAG: hypothetical protein MJB57_16560, partial [Gemmatimonadetes bacterium]|nr:hypothetical protein [Gemmatimonadota bacterium]
PETSLAKWNDWFREISSHVVDLGAPAADPIGVGGAADVDVPMSGYSVVWAESRAAALKIAGDCPIHDEGGTVTVARCLSVRP